MIITNEVLKEIAIKADKVIFNMLDEFEDGDFYDVEIKFTSKNSEEEYKLSNRT